jgi:hypothetical protein
MEAPSLEMLRIRYREMSQDEFDELNPEHLTAISHTAYLEERLKRSKQVEDDLFPEESSHIVGKLPPNELIQHIKEVLGNEYDVWQKKQRIIIRKNAYIGCELKIEYDVHGNIIYENPIAHSSFWFALLITIPFIAAFMMITIFLVSGVLVTITLMLLFGYFIRALVAMPSDGLIKSIDIMLNKPI